MRLGDTEVGEQQGHGFGPHGRAAVGMEGELAWLDILLFAGFLDELLGQFGPSRGATI